MKHTAQLLSIRVADLLPSPFNVRRHHSAPVDELAALIASQGLLHPLMVSEQEVGRGRARKPRFAVVAGERRRRALLLLQQQGRLAKDHEVLCDLVTPERAREISVAENSGREPMHPADEFEAFKAMIDEGKGVEDVAARFGVSTLTVQRRLKLAALSPKLIALYREEGINLDQLMALTLTDDHGAQERAWFEARPWDRDAAALRRALTTGEVQATGNALVRFVGIEAYEAAGGVVRRDLFDGEQAGWISDPVLLRRLVAEKLDGIAELVHAEGWAWVEARESLDSQGLREFSRCEASLRRLTTDESQALDDMKHREAELDAENQAMGESDNWSTVDAERIDLEEQDIAARRAAIQIARQTWRAEDRQHAGAIVTVSREGDAEIIRGLLREAARKAVAAARGRVKGARLGGNAQAEVGAVDGEGDSGSSAEPRERCLSERLLCRLAAHRTVALQAVLSSNTHLALATLANVFVQRVFGDAWGHDKLAMQVTLHLPTQALLSAADDLQTSRAWLAIEASKQCWRERLPEARGEWFNWLIALPQDALLDLLALCAALVLNALPNAAAACDTDAIAAAAGLDMADWWEATAESYLNHVSKAQIVEALAEAGSGPTDVAVGAMKKEVLVALAATRLAGRRWLPLPYRPQAA